VVNFSDSKTYQPNLLIPSEVLTLMGLTSQHTYTFRDLLNGGEAKPGLSVTLPPLSAQVLEIKPK
jgi:hypothetical protein